MPALVGFRVAIRIIRAPNTDMDADESEINMILEEYHRDQYSGTGSVFFLLGYVTTLALRRYFLRLSTRPG